MTEAITNWLIETFTANPYIITSLISVIPMIEVRGAITVGVSLGLNPWITWLLACVSAFVVCPILLLALVPLLRLLKKVKIFAFVAEGLEDMFKGKANKIENDVNGKGKEVSAKKIIFRKSLSVFLFVAIPLPLTGVWTGSAVAAFLDLDYKYSIPAILIGNFISGLIITLLNIILGQYASIILLVLLVFVIISIVSVCIAVFVKYRKKQKNIKEQSTEQTETKDEPLNK